MLITHAITRIPGNDFAQGITTANLGPPVYQKMLVQHQKYVDVLDDLNIQVTILDPLPGFPDAYFMEDVAVMLPEVAVITRPGALSRRGETSAIEPTLQQFRPILRIEPPGTLDGGDVLFVGTHCFIGLSERTNQDGAEQLGNIVNQFRFTSSFVPVASGLHLKSSVNCIGENTLLLNQAYARFVAFQDYDLIVLEPKEEAALNTLWINNHLITPAGYPRAAEKLATLEIPIIELDISEAQKMDGGLSCMSLRFTMSTEPTNQGGNDQ